MPSLDTLVGFMAAFCTTVSYLPQVRKAWKTRSTADLSMGMMLLLFAGLSLWILYGFMKGDYVIIFANTVSLSLLGNLIFLKARELAGHSGPGRRAADANAQGRLPDAAANGGARAGLPG